MSKVISKLLVTAVCAAMAFPTIAPAQDHGHGAHPPSHQQGGGQHYGHDNGYHGNGGPYPHYYGHDQHHNDYGAYRYYNYGGYHPYYYGSPYYGYGAPYYYGHHHYDGNDDALWAIGGLVVGAIIGSAVEHANEHPPATTTAPPPPAAQQQRNCDHVAYDSAGNPYVDRNCPL
jgi:hypothetical protein